MKTLSVFIIGALLCLGASAQLRVKSGGNAAVGNPQNISWMDHTTFSIFGTGTNNGGGNLGFGDNGTLTKNVVIGEYPFSSGGDSDILLLHAKNGIIFSTGSSFSPKCDITSSGTLNFSTTNIYGKINIGAFNSSSGIAFTSSPTFRIFVDGSNAYLTRGGTTNQGIRIGDNGHVGINGYSSSNYWLYVSGDCMANAWHTYSDSTYKKDIDSLKESYKLTLLKPVKYKWNEEKYKRENPRRLPDSLEQEDADTLRFDKKTHYGFLAQDVQKIFPDMVLEDTNGQLSINYTEFIPLLVEGYQEISKEVEDLKKKVKDQKDEIDGLKIRSSLKSGTTLEFENNAKELSTATLFQNNPNPFSEDTEIKTYIPEGSENASIRVYSLNGHQLLKKELYCTGDCSVFIEENELSAGMYLYSLLIGNELIDTKTMVVTE